MSRHRIVVAGCGGMANVWMEYAVNRKDCDIVGLVDLREESARAMMEKHGLGCGIYRDVEAAIAAEGATLVFDVTVPEAHKDITLKALSAGCHVFGEKPMSISLAEAREMAEAAQRAQRSYSVMQNRRFLPGTVSYRNLIRSGAIGQPSFVCADFFLGPHFGGFREAMDSPLIMDMAIHTFDQARFVTGADPVSVYCHEFNPAGSWYAGNAAAVCIFEMSDGSVFSYRGSWCAEGVATSWEAFWRVNGSKGTAVWDGHALPYAEVVKPAEQQSFLNELVRIEAEPAHLNGRDGHFACLDEMFAALEEDRKAETDCTDNLKSMAMVFGALQSAREKRKVDL